MSSITQIATQIVAILDTALSDIDKASLDSYLPLITTRKVALAIPPLGMRGTVGAPVGLKTKLTHRIPCVMWVRLDNGDLGNCLQRARDICLEAAAELQATALPGSALNNTVTYLGDGEGSDPFDWSVEESIFAVGNLDFIRATLFVTVTEWVVLQA